MSIRTNDSKLLAFAMIARTFARHSASSMSSPICVSFSETFASAPAARIRSSVSRYVSRAARASARLCTASPSRSRLAETPAAFSRWEAPTASSTVSPATKRDAKRRASPFERTNPNMRGCSLSQRRPARIIRCQVPGARCRGASGIELAAAARLLLQDLAGGEAGAETFGEPLQLADHPRCAEVVRVAQRPAPKRREPEAEDGGDVAVAGTPHDPVSESARRFVEHDQNEALDDLSGTHAPVRLGADQLVHGAVDRALLATRVPVEAFPCLAAQPAVLHHPGERRGGREPLAEGVVHHARDLFGDVQADLVEQRDRSDGKAPLHHQRVQLVDRDARL